jgi:NAD(P)-dependent dehydrogenase (short-subunit alcohol dehydrogenase family)
MVENEKGSIINMSSVVSSVKGLPSRFAYGTTKAAVIGLTKSLAVDFVERGVRVNCLCPGTVDTPSFRDRVNEFDDPEKALSDFVARQKMGRLGTPQEIAALVTHLASDEVGRHPEVSSSLLHWNIAFAISVRLHDGSGVRLRRRTQCLNPEFVSQLCSRNLNKKVACVKIITDKIHVQLSYAVRATLPLRVTIQ